MQGSNYCANCTVWGTLGRDVGYEKCRKKSECSRNKIFEMLVGVI